MITLSGDINATFRRMEAIIPDIEKKTLNVGANYLKEQVRSAFISKMPSAGKPVRQQTGMRGYKINKGDTLADAVRQTAATGNKTRVHILGAGDPGSAQFIARFYENGTFAHSKRYQRTYRGVKLKKKRNLGGLGGLHFFKPTVLMNIDQTCDLMGKVYEAQIKKFF